MSIWMSEMSLEDGDAQGQAHRFLQENAATLREIAGVYAVRMGLARAGECATLADEIFQDAVLEVLAHPEKFAECRQKAGKLFSEHWNGQAWQEVASPTLPGSFTSISAISPNDIWAVGNNGAIEHWNGQSWQLVMRDSQYTLNAVVARASNDVWVVGNVRSSTLTGHWNGKNWSFTHTSQPTSSPQQVDDFNGVAATATGKILVVGFQRGAAQNTQKPITIVSTCS